MSENIDWLGRGLQFDRGARWNSLRFEAPAAIGKINARDLTIGAWSYLQYGASLNGPVSFGRYCSIGPYLLTHMGEHPTDWLSTSTSQYQRRQFDFWMAEDLPLRKKLMRERRGSRNTIGNDVWFGRNVILQRGVTIGDGAIVGTNAFVTKDVPPYAIVGGLPARIIRMRFDDALIHRLQASQWWQYDRNDLRGVTFEDPNRALDEIEELVATGRLLPRAEAFQKHPGPAS